MSGKLKLINDVIRIHIPAVHRQLHVTPSVSCMCITQDRIKCCPTLYIQGSMADEKCILCWYLPCLVGQVPIRQALMPMLREKYPYSFCTKSSPHPSLKALGIIIMLSLYTQAIIIIIMTR